MTTNHIEQLDAAFIRPGRIDYCLLFHPPDRQTQWECLKVLGEQYSQEHEAYLDAHPQQSIAAMQMHLFQCIMEDKDSIL